MNSLLKTILLALAVATAIAYEAPSVHRGLRKSLKGGKPGKTSRKLGKSKSKSSKSESVSEPAPRALPPPDKSENITPFCGDETDGIDPLAGADAFCQDKGLQIPTEDEVCKYHMQTDTPWEKVAIDMGILDVPAACPKKPRTCPEFGHVWNEDNEELDPTLPKPTKCQMKRKDWYLWFEPKLGQGSVFPEKRPDIFVEVLIPSTGQIIPFYREDRYTDWLQGIIPFDKNNEEDVKRYQVIFNEQEKEFGGQGFKLRYNGMRGPSEWNSCSYSPIAFDLNRDGEVSHITTKSDWPKHEDGFMIDITGDGEIEHLGEWFAPTEGILIDTHNEDGLLDFQNNVITGDHMMGDMAGKYTDGFAKLATYDDNCDDKLTGKELEGLYIWVDANSNLILDDGELKTLAYYDIVELSVIHDELKSHATLADGSEMLMQDLWFDAFQEERRLKSQQARRLNWEATACNNAILCSNGETPAPQPTPTPAPEDTSNRSFEDDTKPKGGQHGSADETCPADMKIGPGKGGDYRCCAGSFDNGKSFGECETSSCPENMNGKNLNCFNYGSPQHPAVDNTGSLSTTKKGGSNNCPYVEADRAICDTSYFTHLNGKNCRDGGKNHCLGMVKCMTEGVTVPKNGNSNGTAPGDGTCGSENFPEGTVCFYNGNSENWKVCGGDPTEEEDTVNICVEEGGSFTMEEILEAGADGELKPGNEIFLDGVKHILSSECEPLKMVPICIEEEGSFTMKEIREAEANGEKNPGDAIMIKGVKHTLTSDCEAIPESEPESEPVSPKSVPLTGSSSGDPHFKTWTGDKYDYHGECDLVLVDNPTFNNGQGLKVHIRTTRVKYFSFIEKVAVQIGTDVLEFGNDVENFYINGEHAGKNQRHHKTMLGGFIVRRDTKFLSIRLHDEGAVSRHAGSVAKIDLHTRTNGFPAVIVDAGHTDVFKGSLGLLGHWATGEKLGRDGNTVFEVDPANAEAFALEWQVHDHEPMLFQETRFPQFPQTCTPPKKMPSNRLGMDNVKQEAEEACSHWKHDVDDCIFDVIATRDVLVAEEGHIVHIE